MTKEEAYNKAKTDIDYSRSLTKKLMDDGYIPKPPEEMLQKALDWAVAQVS
jgi:malate dehydrogenase (oxaloacetate-decarboxylating)